MPEDHQPEPRGEHDGYGPAEEYVAGANAPLRAGRSPDVSPAEWTYQRLCRQIHAFEGKLSENEEVGGRLTSAPGEGTFQIDDLGWWGPDMIIFYGKNQSGRPVQLIQHYTQLNVVLTAVPKVVQAEPPRRIGFALGERLREKQPVNALAGEGQRPEAERSA